MGALNEVFGADKARDSALQIGTVKSNIGHLESAAGVAAVIKVILSMQHNRLPANLHFHELNPKIDLDVILASIVTTHTPWEGTHEKPLRAGISGFGFTGTNAHIILEQGPKQNIQTLQSLDSVRHLIRLMIRQHGLEVV